ncbi:FKBP-type peptidyl-prolyl cis-trans isomerase [Motilimonas sp. 1_MG-2023]|uniref:FKBP-type peptidyl-prolyl cis-trans isomerase n=1 Tax=Motilimonas TaxID=1914248 RepID=UPI001E51E235|nr:FKBP-type peptidyl-prolyl cis-trans isomerase [Motilimonas sp. 1_MG-2023]MCE0557965.1 FKBP-type peptidyl-prolyl cis-trans isomerase [Motilimonas sp. E26]MDO6527319.1 FKBP-type peptidyl-prolyl cis-trans isomerase [Motilimonas sp. 1_MG-2023]
MFKFIIAIALIGFIAFYVTRSANDKRAAADNIAAGEVFLQKNRLEEGVVVTDSGLQYLRLKEGVSGEHPSAKDKVKVHYHGTLINGSVFDSSVDRGKPITFALNQVIPGWTEGLQLMTVGEKARLFIPSNLGYKTRSVGSIPAGSTLIFDVELIAINPPQ